MFLKASAEVSPKRSATKLHWPEDCSSIPPLCFSRVPARRNVLLPRCDETWGIAGREKCHALRFIGPSYRGVWICIAGFRDLQTPSFEIPWFLGRRLEKAIGWWVWGSISVAGLGFSELQGDWRWGGCLFSCSSFGGAWKVCGSSFQHFMKMTFGSFLQIWSSWWLNQPIPKIWVKLGSSSAK